VVNCDASSQSRHAMRGCSPCLTRSRCGAGGHWLSSRSRRMTTQEMLRLQGMSEFYATEALAAGLSSRQLHLAIGNSFSQNVLEHLFYAALPVVGLAEPMALHV